MLMDIFGGGFILHLYQKQTNSECLIEPRLNCHVTSTEEWITALHQVLYLP